MWSSTKNDSPNRYLSNEIVYMYILHCVLCFKTDVRRACEVTLSRDIRDCIEVTVNLHTTDFEHSR